MSEINPHSTAKIADHPLHPMLVPLPIAFFIGALLTDLAFLKLGDPFWARMSFWLIAAGLVGAVWLWPVNDSGMTRSTLTAQAPASHPSFNAVEPSVSPPVPLQTERERLAALVAPAVPAAPPEPEAEITVAVPTPPAASPSPTAAKTRAAAAPLAPPKRAVQPTKTARPSERVATLDRMSAGFFNQSMTNASADKKQLLLAARERSEAKRKACRTDSCVADALVTQIRETGQIMEEPARPRK